MMWLALFLRLGVGAVLRSFWDGGKGTEAQNILDILVLKTGQVAAHTNISLSDVSVFATYEHSYRVCFVEEQGIKKSGLCNIGII